MPGVDWIPGVSQLKSAVQAITGDIEGAERTQRNFSRECPGVAQVTSLVQLATGDVDGALETQSVCLGTVSNIADGIPVVGHAKGIVHHLAGDHEGGDRAFHAATRSAVVVGSGAAAGLATGGLGAIPAGIAAGAGYDVTTTMITGEDQGYVAAFKNASENPSGGSIFDAVALPVGDGLAGYAGGQMANKFKLDLQANEAKIQTLESMKVANEAKIQTLEAARQIKLDKINAIMDGAGTSGEAMQLGAEINQISREIHIAKHGTPQYWTNVKSGKTAPNAASASTSASTSGAAGMPVGYADRSTQGGKRVPSEGNRQHIPVNTEDALYHESYVDSTITASNEQSRQQTMRDLDNKQAQKSIGEAYSNVGFSTLSDLKSLLERINKEQDRDPNSNPNWEKDVKQLIKWCWLILNMPTEFPYTVAVQLNSMIHGYYHSFIRHMNDWSDIISFDDTLIERLNPLIRQIRGYAAATDVESAAAGREDFLAARRLLDSAQYNDIQTALAEIQLSMHSFMQENMTYNNYMGRTITAGGQEQLFFKVKTLSGRTKIMVVCLSSDRYTTNETQDERPLRLLITVFFIPWKKFENKRILETKKQMEEKKKKKK